MNYEYKETLQGQLMQIEEIFDSISSMEMSDDYTGELHDELLYELSNTMDNIKLLIK